MKNRCLFYMSYKIKIRNLTKNSLAKYGQGDTIRLWINPKIHDIKKIEWIFSDGTISNEHEPEHIFLSKGTNYSGQGEVKIKVKVEFENGRKMKLKKKIFISPAINCDIQVGMIAPITDTTSTVIIEAQGLCDALMAGNPIDGGKQGYACGGACNDICPRCEVLCLGIKPSNIIKAKEYGEYKFNAKFIIRCKSQDNEDCIDLYRDNIIGKKSKYRKVKTTYNLCPIVEELYITPDIVEENVERRYRIRNLSDSLLPKKTVIEWEFNNPEIGITKYKTKLGYVDHTINNMLPTTLNIKIKIPTCDTINLSSTINN